MMVSFNNRWINYSVVDAHSIESQIRPPENPSNHKNHVSCLTKKTLFEVNGTVSLVTVT